MIGGGLLLEDRGIDDMTTPALESTKTIKSIAKARGVEGFQLGRSGRIITFIFPSLDQWFLKSLVSTSSSFTKWLFKRELQLQAARASTSLYFSCCLAFLSFWNNFIHFGTILFLLEILSLLSLSRLLSVSSLSSLSRFQAFQLFEPLLALLV